MRRWRTFALGAGIALAGASPAAAANVDVFAKDPGSWEPATVKVAIGDTVTWRFDGTTGFHNVQSAGANWSLAPLPPSPAAPPVTSEPFTVANARYEFVCQVHQDMKGFVEVGEPPPPPLSEQPFVNDSGVPGLFESGAYDDVAPRLSDLRARRAGGGARVSFAVSERSRVTARFVRGGRTRRTARVTVAAGDSRITVRKGLKAGRYRIDLRAEDLAGNRSSKQRLRLTVR